MKNVGIIFCICLITEISKTAIVVNLCTSNNDEYFLLFLTIFEQITDDFLLSQTYNTIIANLSTSIN